MSWATNAIEKLKNGETVQIRPKGSSMKGRIESGNLVTITPFSEEMTEESLEVGDAVLVTVRGNDYLHLIKAVKWSGEKRQYQIGNNRGRINGWTNFSKIYGKVTCVES